MTLNRPVNQRWVKERGENWSHSELVDDGIVKRSVTLEATTRLGRRALQIIEALHCAHLFNELETLAWAAMRTRLLIFGPASTDEKLLGGSCRRRGSLVVR
jgi:hypothetical protein